MSPADCDAITRFVSEFVTKSLVPHMDKRVRMLNNQVNVETRGRRRIARTRRGREVEVEYAGRGDRREMDEVGEMWKHLSAKQVTAVRKGIKNQFKSWGSSLFGKPSVPQAIKLLQNYV